MNTKTHFPFRVDVWDEHTDGVVRHVAGIDDYETAVRPTGRRAIDGQRQKSLFAQGARIIEKSWAAS
jgi:hypothetical protein